MIVKKLILISEILTRRINIPPILFRRASGASWSINKCYCPRYLHFFIFRSRGEVFHIKRGKLCRHPIVKQSKRLYSLVICCCCMVMVSFNFTSREAFTGFPLIFTFPKRQASVAKVRVLKTRTAQSHLSMRTLCSSMRLFFAEIYFDGHPAQIEMLAEFVFEEPFVGIFHILTVAAEKSKHRVMQRQLLNIFYFRIFTFD